jgi:hypothetical protein
MKKILLNAKDQVLSKDEMKAVVGGFGPCSGYTSEQQCVGKPCDLSTGHSGKCGWTDVPTGHCTCAGVIVGGFQ